MNDRIVQVCKQRNTHRCSTKIWYRIYCSFASKGTLKRRTNRHPKLSHEFLLRVYTACPVPWIFEDMNRNCSGINCSGFESAKFDSELCGRFTVFVIENVPRPIVIANCLLNAILLLVSVSANSLVVTAIWRTPGLRYPSVVFLCGLAVSDFAVGLIVQPLFIATELLKIRGHPKGDCSLETAFIILAFTLCGVSFGNVTSISFDRYLAIHYPLRYRTIVTLPRVVFVIVLCWLTRDRKSVV